MGEYEIGGFLTYLAVDEKVAAATQNQALNASVFLYREVVKLDLGEIREASGRHQSTHGERDDS